MQKIFPLMIRNYLLEASKIGILNKPDLRLYTNPFIMSNHHHVSSFYNIIAKICAFIHKNRHHSIDPVSDPELEYIDIVESATHPSVCTIL